MGAALDQPAALTDAMVPQPGCVSRVARETQDTVTLRVAPAPGDSFPAFQPGQFSMLYLFGVAELPISISGDPHDRDVYTYTIRSVGQATQGIVNLKSGAWIGVRGPFGSSWPIEGARGKDVILVAGGIGLAPLRPVLYHIFRHREDYGRIILLYGARSPTDILFPRELRRWERQPNTQILTTVDYGGLTWSGHVGVVTRLFSRLRINPARTIAMTCGPEIMMRYVVAELQQRGVADDRIYVSMERNMKCAVGSCGHCQFGPMFVCKDGPVFPFNSVREWIYKHEI